MSTEKYPAAAQEIHEHFIDHFTAQGMSAGSAEAQATELTDMLVAIYAGQRIYFPESAPQRLDFAKRNEEIRRLWDGKNANHLAKRFGISRSRVWQIVRDISKR